MKIHLRMTGCRLNQSEIEQMMRDFQRQGHEIVTDPADADQIVVNTCAVTQNAVSDSRKLIRTLHRRAPDTPITVTGCWSQLAPDDARALPGVRAVIDNLGKETLVPTLTGEPLPTFEQEPIVRAAPGSLARTRAFIKVQDGCDNACTFCVTTIARGAGRSRPQAEVIAEIAALSAVGCQEAVLTGVHLGSYGHDRGERAGLESLVRAILHETDIPRLRLSSLEPWDLTPDFFKLWRDRRLCPHLHLPLQSGCDATLRRMARRTTQTAFAALVTAARAHCPDIAITSDLIVGFPGETDADFEESAAFVDRIGFAGLHVFRYSRRPGTAAARMRDQVPEAAKTARSTRMIAVAQACEAAYAERFAGQSRPVLWEAIAGVSADGFINVGYTDNYIRVCAVHPRPFSGNIAAAQLDHFDPTTRHMIGAIVEGAGTEKAASPDLERDHYRRMTDD